MARILIVDDAEAERLLLSSILVNAGYEVRFAKEGHSALAKWNSGSFDLVVTDLAMPRLDGLQLIQEIRQADPSARIIAISGVRPDQLGLALEYGAVDALYKPVDPRKLLKAIEEALADGPLGD